MALKNHPQLLTAERFYEETENGKCAVLFVADWCKPCKEPLEHLEIAVELYREQIRLFVFDIEGGGKCTSIAQDHFVRAVPTMISFKNGHRDKVIMGNNSSMVEKIVDHLLS